MPRASKLKVFRTPIGFHDAYVAASSQKAAMAAWGSDGDLFARGEAELVTDPALTEQPLAKPGTVIKRLRGTAEEQIAALPPDKPRKPATAEAAEPERKPRRAEKPVKAPRPRPSRAALDAAERALADAAERQAQRRKGLAEREAALARERRALEKTQAEETEQLERARDEAADAFDTALERWRGG